jgi:hypothetical protein
MSQTVSQEELDRHDILKYGEKVIIGQVTLTASRVLKRTSNYIDYYISCSRQTSVLVGRLKENRTDVLREWIGPLYAFQGIIVKAEYVDSYNAEQKDLRHLLGQEGHYVAAHYTMQFARKLWNANQHAWCKKETDMLVLTMTDQQGVHGDIILGYGWHPHKDDNGIYSIRRIIQ